MAEMRQQRLRNDERNVALTGREECVMTNVRLRALREEDLEKREVA
jgi:hypothetical protein